MGQPATVPVSGHARLVKRKRGDKWYARIRVGEKALREVRDLRPVLCVDQIGRGGRHVDSLARVVLPAILIALHEDR